MFLFLFKSFLVFYVKYCINLSCILFLLFSLNKVILLDFMGVIFFVFYSKKTVVTLVYFIVFFKGSLAPGLTSFDIRAIILACLDNINIWTSLLVVSAGLKCISL